MTVASSGKATVTLPGDTQILIEREFDAPKHLVYKAITTPDLVKRWWAGGPSETPDSNGRKRARTRRCGGWAKMNENAIMDAGITAAKNA